MAWTAADVAALKTSIATGTRAVQYADRSVTYHTLAEMLDLLQRMETEVAGTVETGETARPRSWAVYSTKGF